MLRHTAAADRRGLGWRGGGAGALLQVDLRSREDLAQGGVHVGRPPHELHLAPLRHKPQRVLVGSLGVAEASLHDADVTQGEGGPQCVRGCVPRPLEPGDAVAPPLDEPLRDPRRSRKTMPRKPAAPARTTWSSSVATSMARWACSTVAGTSPRTWASAVRYISIWPGTRRSSPSSTKAISASRAEEPAPSSPVSGISWRSASSNRPSTPDSSPLASTWHRRRRR